MIPRPWAADLDPFGVAIALELTTTTPRHKQLISCRFGELKKELHDEWPSI